jgi:hypothetical protein
LQALLPYDLTNFVVSFSLFALAYSAFGSFYRKYKAGKFKFMWEALILLRKFLIVGSVTLLSSYPYRACMMFALVLVASIVMQIVATPIEGKSIRYCVHSEGFQQHSCHAHHSHRSLLSPP